MAVFTEPDTGVYRFKAAGHWTMPFGDRTLAKEVWAITRGRVVDGNKQLPKSTDHPIAFANTHRRNASYLVPTPSGGREKRRSFWMNKRYLAHLMETRLSQG